MKRTAERLTALLAAALLAFTGCGGKPAVQPLEDPAPQPEYLSFFSSESLSGTDVTKYWTDRFVQEYNKPVYIHFDGAAYYAEDGLSYRELLTRRLQSSSPDDLYIISAEDVLEFEKQGYWMDLSGMDFVSSLSDAALYQSTYNGKVFSVPLSFTGFGFLWNLELLQQHGLAVPQTLTEFWDVCEALQAADVLPYGANKGYALTVPAMCVGLAGLYQSEDLADRLADLNSGETAFSDYLRPGYEFLAHMIERGYMDPQQALEATPHKDDIELFFAGGCAFICSGLGDTAMLETPPFEMQLTGLPVLEKGAVAVYGANSRLCVNPRSKHLETALEFIEMVGAPEALAQSAALDRAMSSAKSGGSATLPMEQPLTELLRQPGQVPNQDFALHFNTWESVRNVGRELCGGAGVDEACALLDEKQRADLAEYAAG